MNETHYIGIYWLNRREPTQESASRAEYLFQLLREYDQRLSQWYEKGWTLEEALAHRLRTEAADIEEVFRQQEQEEGRMTGEGFSLRLWNGEPDDGGLGLSLRCGETTTVLSNNCLIHPPSEGPLSERLLTSAALSRLLQAMVRAWEPEWGVATSHEHRDLVSESAHAGTFIGWLTYFSHRRGPLPALPPPVHVEPVDGLGSLVLLTPERFSPSNPSHLQLAREVTVRLEQAGLLHPLRP